MKIKHEDLLLTIINRGQGDRFVELARSCGATGATVYPAKGTATSSILRMLGLGDTSKDVVLILADKTTSDAICKKAGEDSRIQGISAVLECGGDNNMADTWKMITVIVNDGFADDIMETARRAGATGGTISRARGTAPEGQEERFMGITIVPEKEMVMILCESEKEKAIVDAISTMECFKEPGVGILYTQEVKNFVNLGTSK